MPKISIIVPVCNVEKYLSKCLDSIVNQTLKEIEIICIDDGSTDDSGAILDSYSQKDSRIKVIHKKNSGYGNSMNVGMDCAEGEYIGIVESDDCILPEMYEELYRAGKESNLDFVKSDAVFWWERIGYSYNVHYDYLNEYYDKVLIGNDRHVFYKFLMNIWTGIYKSDFLKKNNIRFNETPGASYQDNGFWFQTMTFAERAMWIGKSYYMYRQDNPMASIKSEAKVLAMSNEYDYITGADCISVLTEPKWFLGSDEYLKEIAKTVSIPCIRKDFTVDEYQIYQAKTLGAAAVLLICSILSDVQLGEYIKICDSLGISALVEIHNEKEAGMAVRAGARIIGVNNRNLKDFTVDTANSRKLRDLIPDDIIFVSESGVKSTDDIRAIREIGADAVLIGETLMRADDKKAKLDELRLS